MIHAWNMYSVAVQHACVSQDSVRTQLGIPVAISGADGLSLQQTLKRFTLPYKCFNCIINDLLIILESRGDTGGLKEQSCIRLFYYLRRYPFYNNFRKI